MVDWTVFVTVVTTGLFGLGGLLLGIMNYRRTPAIERLKADLERETVAFTHNLEKSASVELERFKGEATEREMKLTKLVEKRAAVLEEFYKLLLRAEATFQYLTTQIESSSDPSKEDRANSFWSSFNEMRTFYGQHRIYFKEATCTLIEKVFWPFISSFTEFEVAMIEDIGYDQIEKHKTWRECSKVAMLQIPKLRNEIETEFRTILGAE